jgi:hypothetical protein
MEEYIKVNPKDPIFFKLMQDIVKAIKTNDKDLLEITKKTFADNDFSIFYKSETEEIRVLKKDHSPVDFPISRFDNLE